MPNSNVTKVGERQQRGAVIRATFLNRIVEVVDGRADIITNPRQRAGERQQIQGDVDPTGQPALSADQVFTEIGRTVSTVRVEDPDDADVYVDVERIDTVTFIGTNGRTMLLVFNNT